MKTTSLYRPTCGRALSSWNRSAKIPWLVVGTSFAASYFAGRFMYADNETSTQHQELSASFALVFWVMTTIPTKSYSMFALYFMNVNVEVRTILCVHFQVPSMDMLRKPRHYIFTNLVWFRDIFVLFCRKFLRYFFSSWQNEIDLAR